jgi:very-short-patch-repair endonuclease
MRQSLLPLAKSMRSTSTQAESRLWWHLRAARFRGFKFRRQQPLGDYIVDFICFDRKLIVEVDGSQHLEAVWQDDVRTAWLESQGFTVLRFWNDAVLRDTGCVLEEILRMLDREA